MSGRECSLNLVYSFWNRESRLKMCCWYSEWRVAILCNIFRRKRMDLSSLFSKQHEKALPSARTSFPLVYRGKFISWGVTVSKLDCIAFKNELLPLQRGVLCPVGFPTWASTSSKVSIAQCRFIHRTVLEPVPPPTQVRGGSGFSGSHSSYLRELKYWPPRN